MDAAGAAREVEENGMARVPFVDKGECIGCGVCVKTVSGVFRFDGNGKSEVYDPEGEPEEKIREAMEMCPVACIRWKEEAGRLH